MNDSEKNELIEVIVTAGLLEDFLHFLSLKGIEADMKKIYDIDGNLIYEYVRTKGLLKETELSVELQDNSNYEDFEPAHQKPKTPPKSGE